MMRTKMAMTSRSGTMTTAARSMATMRITVSMMALMNRKASGRTKTRKRDVDDEGDALDPIALMNEDHFEFDGDLMADEHNGEGGLPAPGVLSNLLRVLGDHDLDGPAGMGHPVPPERIVPTAGSGEPVDEDDEEEDDEEGEDMDENEEMAFERDFEILEHADHLMWDHPPMLRRHRQLRGPGAWSFSRRIGGRDDLNPNARSGRLAPHGRTGGDDGTNPLLRRPQPESRPRPTHPLPNVVLPPGFEAVLPGMAGFPPLQAAFQTADTHGAAGGHGAVIDAIFQALQRGDLETGQVRLRMSGPLAAVRDTWRSSGWDPRHHRHVSREDQQRPSNFVPALTMTRWQEEARLLFGSTYLDKLQRVQIWVMSVLVPLAQQEEKERQRKREEELKTEREEAEKLKAEVELRQKLADEHKAREREREELEAAAAAAAAAEASGQEEADQHQNEGDADHMEDVQSTDAAAAQETADSAASTSAAVETPSANFHYD